MVQMSGNMVGSSNWLTNAIDCFTDSAYWGILSGLHTSVYQIDFCLRVYVDCTSTDSRYIKGKSISYCKLTSILANIMW